MAPFVEFWTSNRIAGGVLALAGIVYALPALGVLAFGKITAAEATFRELEHAVGHTNSYRVLTAAAAPAAILSLAGIVLFSLALWNAGARALPVLAAVAFTIYIAFLLLETAFHMSLTVWAIQQLEAGADVPEIYDRARAWLNVWLQVFVNPLALLSFVGLGLASVKTGLLWPWAGWFMVGWGVVWLIFPLPLAIAPIPILLGIALLVHG
jgi:hypothetical protein